MHSVVKTFLLLILAASIFTLPGVNAATPHHSLEDIKSTVRQFVLASLPAGGSGFTVSANKLDPRLRLSPCNAPLQAWYPNRGRRAGNLTVGVKCPGEKPWTVYIPVTVNFYQEVVVTDRPLQRGAVITENDLRIERKNLSFRADSYFTDMEEVVGRELVHSLQMGHVLSERNLKLPVVIRRGQQVTLLAKSDTYEVRMSGEAMMDGVAGQRIKVRNSRSRRVIEGVVKSSKIIYIE